MRAVVIVAEAAGKKFFSDCGSRTEYLRKQAIFRPGIPASILLITHAHDHTGMPLPAGFAPTRGDARADIKVLATAHTPACRKPSGEPLLPAGKKKITSHHTQWRAPARSACRKESHIACNTIEHRHSWVRDVTARFIEAAVYQRAQMIQLLPAISK